ncbi:hypothetical protein KIL84_014321 [Mauremys mutica]|uniref:Secreted protein n=1 Tax=Mauremys mutica TaxID=74926 RepID=A0A9D4B7X3_9SAUR|nr:hypothetical protein KIL84_014321 [Mauremys mutica]
MRSCSAITAGHWNLTWLLGCLAYDCIGVQCEETSRKGSIAQDTTLLGKHLRVVTGQWQSHRPEELACPLAALSKMVLAKRPKSRNKGTLAGLKGSWSGQLD